MHIYIYMYALYFFPVALRPKVGQPYSVRLLWTSDRLVAETSN